MCGGSSELPASDLPHQPAGRSRSHFHAILLFDSAAEPLPSQLDTVSQSRYTLASQAKLDAVYAGKGNHSHDVGTIRADQPCPTQCAVYYFEVAVVDAGERNALTVGLCQSSFPMTRQPGWEPHSYGYHASDGCKYNDSERGEPYGPGWGKDDVIGCGIENGMRSIFWTKNGMCPPCHRAADACESVDCAERYGHLARARTSQLFGLVALTLCMLHPVGSQEST
eukprot:scaffold287950_cov33-Tisochrysis_lutea.AAC.2